VASKTLPRLVLELPPDTAYLPTAAAAAKNASQIFGLGSDKALRLSLAVEEFYAYLCRFAEHAEPIRLTLEGGGTFARAEFRFQAGEINLHALNFAAQPPGQNELELDETDDLGLIVTARTIDRCRLERSGPDVFHLIAEVDRDYPEAAPMTTLQKLTPPLRLHPEPTSGMLRHAAMLAAGRYSPRICPRSFSQPERFADMVATGQYSALLAVDATNKPAGLLCWREQGRQSIFFSGPYTFSPALSENIATMLTEGFLSLVARTEAVCALSERPTPDLPEGWFEKLGTLLLHSPGQPNHPSPPPVEQPALYRHLREDAGAAVWAHPELHAFLEGEYHRLAFSRDILTPSDTSGRPAGSFSLLMTELDQGKGLARLRPLLDGADFATNLAVHVAALRALGILNIVLRLDLSEPWQGELYPLLPEAGFQPRLVLPNAGNSDILVCQHVSVIS